MDVHIEKVMKHVILTIECADADEAEHLYDLVMSQMLDSDSIILKWKDEAPS